MQLPLSGLMPPDPPEKWTTIQGALDSPAKTRRLCAILLVSSLPLLLVLALIAVLAVAAHVRL